jgi:hypothetical protein
MQVVSELTDNRINARNFLVEMTIEEYLGFAQEVLHRNEFQRRQVRSSKTVYALLQEDLKRGCIIPPVVLALTSDIGDLNPGQDEFETILRENREHLVILDGLQRTYTMIRLVDSLRDRGDQSELRNVLAHPVRAEFYVGLNRLGILYRMLTLNTGQTPMSLRQQIEILYLDYADTDIDNIELIREVDDRRATNINQYNFRDVVEGFNSYLDRNE